MFRRFGFTAALLPVSLVCFMAAPASAQSPNTATMIVEVVDQSGAVLKDVGVSVTNDATGAVREAVSGSDGNATIQALPLTGTYTVSVSKAGFSKEELKEIALRSGETSTLKVKLLVGSAKAEVTVYGTAEGVRADAEIGRSFEISSSTKPITPRARVHAVPPPPHWTAPTTTRRGAGRR
jgi:uncharacterized membrane protein